MTRALAWHDRPSASNRRHRRAIRRAMRTRTGRYASRSATPAVSSASPASRVCAFNTRTPRRAAPVRWTDVPAQASKSSSTKPRAADRRSNRCVTDRRSTPAQWTRVDATASRSTEAAAYSIDRLHTPGRAKTPRVKRGAGATGAYLGWALPANNAIFRLRPRGSPNRHPRTAALSPATRVSTPARIARTQRFKPGDPSM
jgi:hypothetical protein